MTVLSVPRIKSSLKAWAVGSLGSENLITKEVFNIVEQRDETKLLLSLLRGFDTRKQHTVHWNRSWREQGRIDQHCLWESERHRAADGRTPIMCSLLATPRYPMLARMGADLTDLRAVMRSSGPGSLAGLSAQAALDNGPMSHRQLGEAARVGVQRWRRAMVQALLDSGSKTLALCEDNAKRTSLHYSAAIGDEAIARALLAHGADVGAKDIHGRTAAHVAAANGHTSMASLLAARTTESETSCRDAFGHTVCDIISLRSECWETIPRHSSISAEDLFRNFISVNRPVLVRGGASHLPAMKKWSSPEKMSSIVRDHKLSNGLIPYKAAARSTLERFVLASNSGSENFTAHPQPYVFDVSIGARCPEIVSDSVLLPLEVRHKNVAYMRMPQFGLGFRGAGAPMHSHYSALNALFHGTKRWFLTPPHAAYWSFEPSASWLQSPECTALRNDGLLLEITQCAGDLIFVPSGWGHATLLEEFGVGIGQEFISNCAMAA